MTSLTKVESRLQALAAPKGLDALKGAALFWSSVETLAVSLQAMGFKVGASDLKYGEVSFLGIGTSEADLSRVVELLDASFGTDLSDRPASRRNSGISDLWGDRTVKINTNNMRGEIELRVDVSEKRPEYELRLLWYPA